MPDTHPTRPVRILHLEDSSVDHALVKFALQRSGLQHEIQLVETLDDFGREVGAGGYDIVLADYHLPGFSGLPSLRQNLIIFVKIVRHFVT